MAQVIENQAQIQGQIQTIGEHPSLPGYDVVSLLIMSSQPVPGKVNLLSQPVGTSLNLTVKHSLLAEAKVGFYLRCRAKLVPDGAMCEKEPEPGTFTIGDQP
jgi:hypothetical protein